MNRPGSPRTRRVVLRLIAVALTVAAALCVCLLPFAGRYLVVEQPLEHADAIVVLAGARAERWLEAVDLYRAGWAPRIVLSRGRIEDAETRLVGLGVRFPQEADLVRDAMLQMHVPPAAIAMLPESLDNTAQEAASTRRMAAASGWNRIIVITSKYHSRRASYAFAREFRRTPVRVLMRTTRYDASVPERWWTNRQDVRYVTSELQKLVAYRLGLGQ
jgi:uncharacterized SAM-binding protein YcdF (DUF218 family)